MRLSKQTRKDIAGRSVAALAKFKDAQGNRLSHQAIGAEINRRVAVHHKTHPAIVKHAAKVASRVLGRNQQKCGHPG